jgi:hypothetical protein
MTEVRELIDAELDGVCGGFLDLTSVTKDIVNVQAITQNGAAIGGNALAGVAGAVTAGSATLAQVANNTSTNVIS